MRVSCSFVLLSVIVLFLQFSCKKTDPAADRPSVLNITPSSLDIPKNLVQGYRLAVQLNTATVPVDQIKWSSEDTLVATVNAQGRVFGVGEGETTVVATLLNGRGTGKCRIRVHDESAYKFRLVLKDKATSDYSANQPEKFLSAKAIARRKKWNIAVNETDLPIVQVRI